MDLLLLTPHPAGDQGTRLVLPMTVYVFPYIVVGRRGHMNVLKTFLKKLVIRRRASLPPRLSEPESMNQDVRREKLVVGWGAVWIL
jgi:hypothetical protein